MPLLSSFYSQLRKDAAHPYSRSTFIGIRAAINRHIRGEPYYRSFNIISDSLFEPANRAFAQSEKRGPTRTEPIAIESSDLRKMFASRILSLASPQTLLWKVFFEVLLQLGYMSKQQLQGLKRDWFRFGQDENGLRYVTLESSGRVTDSSNEPRMYERPGDENCPVKSLALMLKKLHPKCCYVFQKPKEKYPRDSTSSWYYGRVVGVNMLASYMRQISDAARLSRSYTNFSIKATSLKALSCAGVSAADISTVYKFASASVLQQNIDCGTVKVCAERRKSMSNVLSACCSRPL